MAAFNLRALGKRLGVRPSAFYWHVGGKDEILSRMAGTFYRTAYQSCPKGVGWVEWLRSYSHAFRKALLAQRDSAQICILAKPFGIPVEVAIERIAAPLLAGGLNLEEAMSLQGAIIAYTLGWVGYEQSSGMHDRLERMLNFEESYVRGLEAMLRGFAEERAQDTR